LSGWSYFEALLGNPREARKLADAALKGSRNRTVRINIAGAMVLLGDNERAKTMLDELAKEFPEDTQINVIQMPAILAQISLNKKDPLRAIELLQNLGPYEFANLDGIYERGNAYLALGKGKEAAGEFQKLLDHRGLVRNDPKGALAHLGLARAYVMQGDTAKAKAAYQDFLTLWKDADPDIPIFIAAKAEYAKLH
jgi:eukaryotic-like serine/threonine-protein kinase